MIGKFKELALKVNGYSILGLVISISVVLILFTERPSRPADQNVQGRFTSTSILTGVVKVVDGDTIRLGSERIRLFGIDAPEKSQLCTIRDVTTGCGDAATNALRSFSEGKTASCAPQGRDRYSRIIAICKIDGVDIGALMVEQGLAVAYTKYATMYVPLEKEARIGNKGIWAGEFESPEDWRRSQ